MSHFIFYYAERHYAECRYAERHYAECRYAESRTAKSLDLITYKSMQYWTPAIFCIL